MAIKIVVDEWIANHSSVFSVPARVAALEGNRLNWKKQYTKQVSSEQVDECKEDKD